MENRCIWPSSKPDGGLLYFIEKKDMEDLPVYKAVVNDGDDTGMITVSLVDFPAVERDFVAFSRERLTYSVADTEKRRVFGLVMLCDTPIYRRDETGYEYYIVYDRPTIELMAEKFLRQNRQNDVDLQHSFVMEDGVYLNEIFIKDSARGIVPAGFEDIRDGSLFATYHIANDGIWEAVKAGTYRGFSLSGTFEVRPAFNKTEKNSLQMKVERIKSVLRRLLAEFGEVSTDRGVLVWDGEDELTEGAQVRLLDAEGNTAPAEDGEYRTEDGQIITVSGGSVESIQDEQRPAGEQQEQEQEQEPAGEQEQEQEPGGEQEQEPAPDGKDARISELEEQMRERDARIAELEAQLSERDGRIAELEARIAELEKEPADAPAQEAFEKAVRKSDPKSDSLRKRGYRW